MTDTTDIPLLDLGPFLAGELGALEATAARLCHINETVGFLYIANHGVPQSLIDDTFDATRRFHSQATEDKLALKVDATMQGYLPMRGSTTRSSTVAVNTKPNENEAFFLKRNSDRWPPGVPGFRETTLAYYAATEALARRMLPLYAVALDLPPDYFDAKCTEPFSSLRLTHYPPVSAYAEGTFGIAPHTDSSFVTLLAQNKVPGLQIRLTDGQWIDAPVVDGTFIVNTGNVLHRWTNGRFLSTPHRAFNTSSQPRYAIPYFFHPNAETVIECLPTCSGSGPAEDPITVADYMAWFRGQNYNHLRQPEPVAA